jgi:Na+-driven multidrug efflux pump
MPEMGIRGMGLGLGIAHTLGFLLLLLFIALRKTKLDIYPRYIFRPMWKIIANVFRLGYPVSAEQLTWTFGLLVIQGYVARLGNTDYYKFHQVIFQVLEMISVIYQGIGIAKMSMIGNAIGRRDHSMEWHLHKMARNTVLPIAVIAGIVIFFRAEVIMQAFLPDIADVSVGANVLRFFAFMQIPRSLSVMTSAHLRARGDVIWMLITTSILSIIFMITLPYIIGLRMGYGLMGIWVLISLNEVSKYIWHRIRLSKEKFKRV